MMYSRLAGAVDPWKVRCMRAGGMILLAALAAPVLRAQDYAPRLNFEARLEPEGRLMHGAGQSPDAFAAYWDQMPAGGRPIVYMHYIGLKGLQPGWAKTLKAELLRYPLFVLPQIGLSMTTDGTPSAHYEQDVAAGDYDEEIGYLVEGLRYLATPVYLRIGYEFNGVSWNGYEPDTYRQAYIRITNEVRDADLEVATVWTASIDGVRSFFDYYPGDLYVDWFGIDIFSAEHFTDPDVESFLESARDHDKPVMVGETTPRFVGAQHRAASWSDWFVPFFDFLQTHPEVKQFNYINWDWAYWAAQIGADWDDWGDARLETTAAAYVRERYIDELDDPVVLHATSESAFRALLDYQDNKDPAAVTNLSADPVPGGIALTWTPVTDASDIARYYVYRNGSLVDYTLDIPYVDRDVSLGATTYELAAMDRAGNLGPRSAPLAVTLDQIERVINGTFEEGLSEWRIETFSAQAEAGAVVDAESPIEGSNSARVTITQSTNTDWHIQLRQFFEMTAGETYTIRFTARASKSATVSLVLQKPAEPFTIYLSQPVALSQSAEEVELTYQATASGEVALSFFLGAIGKATVWVDDVSVREGAPSGTNSVPPAAEVPRAFALRQNYPNPFNPETVIPFDVATASDVSIRVYDALGREVAGLAGGTYPPGTHRVAWQAAGVPSGLYLVRMDAGGQVFTRTVVLAK